MVPRDALLDVGAEVEPGVVVAPWLASLPGFAVPPEQPQKPQTNIAANHNVRVDMKVTLFGASDRTNGTIGETCLQVISILIAEWQGIVTRVVPSECLGVARLGVVYDGFHR